MPVTARRTQEQRSEETRSKLLQATIAVLLDRGYAGLTVDEVDTRAGLSAGARVHHYPAKADLVVAATRYAYQRAAELGRQRAIRARRSAEPLADLVADLRSVYFDWPFLAAIEVVMAARTNAKLLAQLRPVLDEFHTGMKGIWLDTLVVTGMEQAAADLAFSMTLNLVRGMALNGIWQKDAGDRDQLLERWCALSGAIARGGTMGGA